MQEAFYKVAFCKKLYHSIEEIQADFDEFMLWYNTVQTNRGKYCKGRTPRESFRFQGIRKGGLTPLR